MSHPAALRHLPHPWLDNAWPKPVGRPDVFYQLKSFSVASLPAEYPYRPILQHDDIVIHYFLFCGFGMPPSDLGYSGDIYMDVTKETYALYARQHIGWMPWTGALLFAGKPRKLAHLLVHPNLPGYYLWCKGNDITWVSSQQFSKNVSGHAIDWSTDTMDVNVLVAITEGVMWGGQKRKWDGAMVLDEKTSKKRSKRTELEEGQILDHEDDGSTWILHDSFIRLQEQYEVLSKTNLENVSMIQACQLHASEVDRLGSDYAKLENKLKKLGEEKTALEGKLGVLRRAWGKYENVVTRLQATRAKLQAGNLVLKEELDESGKRHKSLEESSKQAVRRLNEEVRATGAKLRVDNLVLKGELDESGKRHKILEESSKQAVRRLNEEVGTLRVGNAVLRQSNTNRNREKLEELSKQQSERLENNRAAMEALQKTILDLEAKNRDLQQKCGRLEQNIVPQINQYTENKDLAEENGQLRAQLAEAERRHLKAEEKNRTLKGKLERERRVVEQIRSTVAGAVEQDIFRMGSISEHLRNRGNAGLSDGPTAIVKKESVKGDPDWMAKSEAEESKLDSLHGK